MKITWQVLLFSLSAWAFAPLPHVLALHSPFDVGNKAQLFVDRVLVREANHVWFTQHQGEKHPKSPVLKSNQPWEEWRVDGNGCVLYDAQENLFKMWYAVLRDDRPSEYFDAVYFTCYATSQDGIHWEKPLVGTLPSKNGKPHNAVLPVETSSVIKDLDDPDPARRYKLIGFLRDPVGYFTFISPDGLHWKQFSKSPITPGSDVISGFWDPRRKLYVAFPKQGRSWRGYPRRVFSTITSNDFVHWSDPVLSWKPDLRDDAGSLARIERVRPMLDRPDNPELMRTEFYSVSVYLAESCTIGFPWMLTINNNARYGNHEGPMEIQLAVSRDLMNWQRPFRTPVIEHGLLEPRNEGYHTAVSTAIRVGDEIWLYYGDGNYTHGTPCLYAEKYRETSESTGRRTKYDCRIGLVTWKLDRFVSVDGAAEGGSLTTVPIRFTGRRLVVNAATKAGGHIVVELLDAAGRPLDGFPPSDPFAGDDLRHVVTFRGSQDVSSMAGKPLSLRFRLCNAELYSFAFRE